MRRFPLTPVCPSTSYPSSFQDCSLSLYHTPIKIICSSSSCFPGLSPRPHSLSQQHILNQPTHGHRPSVSPRCSVHSTSPSFTMCSSHGLFAVCCGLPRGTNQDTHDKESVHYSFIYLSIISLSPYKYSSASRFSTCIRVSIYSNQSIHSIHSRQHTSPPKDPPAGSLTGTLLRLLPLKNAVQSRSQPLMQSLPSLRRALYR